MKKITFMLIALITFSVSAQKKKNGTVYVDHPAIDMVESFQNAWVSGDLDKAKSFLAEDFRIFNGVGLNKNAKGWTKTQFVGNMTWWVNNMDYFQIKRSEGAYPDAIEYKEGDQLWVQTWDHLYGVNKISKNMTTGHDDIKQIMFNAFIVIQKMDLGLTIYSLQRYLESD